MQVNIRQRINTKKFIHVKRVLTGQGELKIYPNEEVSPQDILGSSFLSPGFSAVNLASRLGVGPSEGAKYLQKPIGASIFKGELLAQKQGLLGEKVIIAPTDGVVDHYDEKSGDLKIKFIPKHIPLAAGVYGIVDVVDKKRGEVFIRTMVTEIFGLVGSGKDRSGVLAVLPNGDLAGPNVITANLAQHIVVAGNLIYGEALKKAASTGISGIVTGGINAADFEAISGSMDPKTSIGSEVGMSLLVIEGFGPISIGEDILTEIKKYEGKFVFIEGNNRRLILPSANADSILTLRKTIVPITNAPEKNEVQVGELKVGLGIRIVWPPFMGALGKIVAIDKTVTVLESGIATILVTVETRTRKIKVPYTNIELI